MVSITRFEKVRERWQERIRNLPSAFARSWLIVVSVLVVFAATNLISLFAFNHTPHVADSAAYIFQAKTFSKGLLYGLLPQPFMFFMGGAL
jgi:hypothetical protein